MIQPQLVLIVSIGSIHHNSKFFDFMMLIDFGCMRCGELKLRPLVSEVLVSLYIIGRLYEVKKMMMNSAYLGCLTSVQLMKQGC
jgi:TctA family transporter